MANKTGKPTVGVIIRHQHFGLIAALIAVCIIFSFVAPNFLTVRNFVNLLQSVSFLGIIALGMTLVILAGEIDISVGSALALYSAILAILPFYHDWPLWGSVILVLVLGTVVGGLAGWIRDKFDVPSFIVTLALLSSLRGFGLLMTNASGVVIMSEKFYFIGGGRVYGVPVPVIIFAVFTLVFWFIAEKTTFGQAVYAVGGNPEAARTSGISLTRIRTLVFASTGFLSAVSAILISSQIGAGNAGIGQGAEFQVIASVIVGGTSLYGGRGSMVGTVIGVIFVGVLTNGLVLMGANQYAQQISQGFIILLAVLASEGFRGGILQARFRSLLNGRRS